MSNNQLWMLGTVDPIQTEIDFLRSQLIEAHRSGDVAREAIIISNLRSFEQLRATG